MYPGCRIAEYIRVGSPIQGNGFTVTIVVMPKKRIFFFNCSGKFAGFLFLWKRNMDYYSYYYSVITYLLILTMTITISITITSYHYQQNNNVKFYQHCYYNSRSNIKIPLNPDCR